MFYFKFENMVTNSIPFKNEVDDIEEDNSV